MSGQDLVPAVQRPHQVPSDRLALPCEVTMVLDFDAHGSNDRPFVIRRQYVVFLHQVFDE